MKLRVEKTIDIAACRALRRVVFMEEQGVSLADEIDDLDELSTHLIAIVDGDFVGTARVHITGKMAKIARVCVLFPVRGRGVGVALIKAALEVGRSANGVTQAKLGAQTEAIGFYQRLGFEPVGPVYDDAGIPHQDMVLFL